MLTIPNKKQQLKQAKNIKQKNYLKTKILTINYYRNNFGTNKKLNCNYNKKILNYAETKANKKKLTFICS